MLSSRLATSVIIIAILVAVLAIDQGIAPWYPLWFLTACLVMGAAALEAIGLLDAGGLRASRTAVLSGLLALLVANWAPHVFGPLAMPEHLRDQYPHHDVLAPVHALAWPCWAFAAVVMFTFVGQSVRYREPGGTMAAIAASVLVQAYVGMLGSFVIQLRWLDAATGPLIPLVAMIAAAKGSDIGAYTAGRLFGRHKLSPRLSPNKTVEGSIGGLVLATLAALLVVAVARGMGRPTLTWPAAAGFGLVVGAAAQLGDLMESMMKRDCARKDASAALPGFGGVLDVMDSLLFAGPVAYGYWLCFGP